MVDSREKAKARLKMTREARPGEGLTSDLEVLAVLLRAGRIMDLDVRKTLEVLVPPLMIVQPAAEPHWGLSVLISKMGMVSRPRLL